MDLIVTGIIDSLEVLPIETWQVLIALGVALWVGPPMWARIRGRFARVPEVTGIGPRFNFPVAQSEAGRFADLFPRIKEVADIHTPLGSLASVFGSSDSKIKYRALTMNLRELEIPYPDHGTNGQIHEFYVELAALSQNRNIKDARTLKDRMEEQGLFSAEDDDTSR